MQYLHLTWFSIIVFTFFSCQDDPELTEEPAPTQDFSVETIIPTGNEQYLSLDSDYLFDQDKLPTFELTLPPAALAKLDADPTAEEYVEGSLTFEGETLSPVGIRYKGSVGAFVNCLSGTDWANPSGYKTCTKLSMKIKVNWQDKDDKFYGVKKLQFHSQNLDDSQMRDRLGYWLFRQMGVPAPRAIHAKLVINGIYTGLYSMVEQIDGRFTRYNFDDGSGNLYKEIWPLRANGNPYSETTYLNHLETNEDENSSAEMIRTFAQEVANASEEELPQVVSNWMDIEEVISYAVVDRTIRVDDGPFHWYCGGTECTNHNYFWYEDPSRNKLHLIPWDLDNAFENIISNINPVTPIADNWGEITADCDPFRYGNFQLLQRSAACDKLTAGWVSFEEEYEQTLADFKIGPLSEEKVEEQLNAWIAQIREATAEASLLHDDAISEEQWENELTKLRQRLDFARIP